MNLTSTAKTAVQSILTNKGRSLLTMLGVIIGVAAVILLVAIGNGLQVYISDQFENFGSNNIFITPGEVFGEGSGGFNQNEQFSALINNKLVEEDVRNLNRMREYVDSVSGLSISTIRATYSKEQTRVSVAGVHHTYDEITNTNTTKGRFHSQTETTQGDRIAVLGSKVSQDLFSSVDPIGKKIKLGNRSYEVIGVAEEKGGGLGGPSFDEYVYVPMQSYFDLFNNKQITRIIVKAKSSDQLSETVIAIKKELGKRLEEDEFSVFEQKEILSVIKQILDALTAGLGGIAAISLFVGGIGIMNIMLVSVTERTREIGLRKALGATPNDILIQFLIEAIILSVLGGLIGVLIAYGGSILINNFFPAIVDVKAVLLAFLVSTLVGIIFGVYPARKASQLSPIEALRYE